MSILVGPLVRTVDELGATCDGQETDPVTFDELRLLAFEKNKKCYNVGTLADWLSQPSLRNPHKFKNTDPASRAPFSAEERADIFRTSGRPDPSGGDATRWDTHRNHGPTLGLIEASSRGDDVVVAQLIAAGADVRAENDEPLFSAVKNGHTAVVARLIDAGADARARRSSALFTAALYGYEAILAQLIAAGASVRAQGADALFHAAVNGHTAVVARLIDAGADVHADDDDALVAAAEHGHDAILALLITAGADVRAQYDEALFRAASNGHDAVVARLISAGASLKARGEEALMFAAKNGHGAVAERLIAAGASPEKTIRFFDQIADYVDAEHRTSHINMAARLRAAAASRRV